MGKGYYYDEKVPPDHENPEHGLEYNCSCHCDLCKRIRAGLKFDKVRARLKFDKVRK
jgi:uncharacterized protein YuzB (UPF0349 family)